MPQPPPSNSPANNVHLATTYVLVPEAGAVAAQVPEGVELSQVFATLACHRWRIFTIGAVVFLGVVAFTLCSRMNFVSTARLYLGELEERSRSAGSANAEVDFSGGARGDMGSEIEILNSRSLVTRAIQGSGLNVTIEPVGWRPPRYWKWLLSRRSAPLDVARRELRAVDASTTERSAAPVILDVVFTNDLEYEVHAAGAIVGHGKLGASCTAAGASFTLLPGNGGSPPAQARYRIEVESMDDAVDAALKSLEVSVPSSKATMANETIKVAVLRFRDNSPQKAADFLRHLMLGYLDERQTWQAENETAAESFVTGQLDKARETLDAIQAKLAEYRSNHSEVVLDSEARAIVDQLGKYEEQRVASELEVESLAAVQQQLAAPKPPPLEAYMLGEAKEDTVLTTMASALSEAQLKLNDAEVRFNDPAPEVKDQRARVDGQLRAIRGYVDSRLTRGRDNLRTLGAVIGQFQQKLRGVPGAEMGLAQLTREAEVYSSMYSFLLRQQQETSLAKASTISKNRILDAPEAPCREETQALVFALSSAPFGVMLGVVVVLIRSIGAGRLEHNADVRRYLGEAPIFASVSRIRRPADGTAGTAAVQKGFRDLCANLYNACGRQDGGVVVFTSPGTGDGKTTCARFVATTLARAGRSVLVVDMNAAAPASDADLATDAHRRALDRMVFPREQWRDELQEVPVTGGGRFEILRAGSDESIPLLSGGPLLDFVESARERYEFVLFDAPSEPAGETLMLSTLADCVVMVVRLGHTERSPALETFKRLRANSLSCGVVMNSVN
jgi:uncharacterized protein involved in exopolysaccharide biosynthesis